MTTISHDDCWLYAGLITSSGYGLVYSGHKTYGAHRVMYENVHGLLAPDLVIDHVCRVRHCVNPMHMEPVTQTVNKMRGLSPAALNGRKTHCNRGHPYSEANTRIDPRGWRVCRDCRKVWDDRRPPRKR